MNVTSLKNRDLERQIRLAFHQLKEASDAACDPYLPYTERERWRKKRRNASHRLRRLQNEQKRRRVEAVI